LKYDLKSWNKEVSGIIGTYKYIIIKEMCDLDKLDDDNKLRHTKLLSELKMLLQKEKPLLTQG